MRHHYSPRKRKIFGVTTRVWDHVFGTAISVPRQGSRVVLSVARAPPAAQRSLAPR